MTLYSLIYIVYSAYYSFLTNVGVHLNFHLNPSPFVYIDVSRPSYQSI